MFSLTLTIQLALNTIMISITLLQVCVYSFQDSIQHVFFTHVYLNLNNHILFKIVKKGIDAKNYNIIFIS